MDIKITSYYFEPHLSDFCISSIESKLRAEVKGYDDQTPGQQLRGKTL